MAKQQVTEMTKEAKAEQVERLDLRSHHIAEDRLAELLRLFPEVRTEGQKLDFNRLKQALGESVDVGKERYGLTWPGKADCFKTIQTPSLGTLRPMPKESVNWDTTENLIIEGDNLEVLKLLQKSYLGKVKMIYIDPPYNTGNDFIYPDNFSESLDTYLQYTGQADAEGKKFSTNAETDGRFHSKWLNMMYPRLYLARNLLKSDGVIFVTIDDSEVHNLLALLNEVFGEENFVTSISWQKKVSPANDAKWFSGDHDWILVYARDKQSWRPQRLEMNERQISYYQNPDDDPRGPWNSSTYTSPKTKEERPNLYYAIKNPNTGEEVWPSPTAVWAFSPELHAKHVADKLLYWGKDGKGTKPRFKKFLSEATRGVVPRSVWPYSEVGSTQSATQVLQQLIPGVPFDTPKPPQLVERMLQISSLPDEEAIILDFFAGSGATGQAVVELNAKDDGNRRFILVQLPELVEGGGPFSTIADITKERMRRVAANQKKGSQETLKLAEAKARDSGFKVYKLAESNISPWDSEASNDPGKLQTQLMKHVQHVRSDRTSEDLLAELLLKSGFPLTTRVDQQSCGGKAVHAVAGGALLVCLARDLTLEAVRAMADLKPERVICLDAGFAGNDQLKTNAVQTFKAKGVVFKTV
jgi:adenine-specific DNA-methyltransferase